jgi:transposase
VCPAQHHASIRAATRTVQFPAAMCRACALRAACTTAPAGRSITLHPDEAFLQRLRAAMQTAGGRATLRRRTTIEHTLARLTQIQGPKARDNGVRKNTLDAWRYATVVNLQRLARLRAAA